MDRTEANRYIAVRIRVVHIWRTNNCVFLHFWINKKVIVCMSWARTIGLLAFHLHTHKIQLIQPNDLNNRSFLGTLKYKLKKSVVYPITIVKWGLLNGLKYIIRYFLCIFPLPQSRTTLLGVAAFFLRKHWENIYIFHIRYLYLDVVYIEFFVWQVS